MLTIDRPQISRHARFERAGSSCQGFIHRQGAISKATNARLIPECLQKSLAETDANILDRVVSIDV